METFCSSEHCRHIHAFQQASQAKWKCQQVTRKVLRNKRLDSTQAAEAAVLFPFCVWVPVCATLACWQVSNETRSVLGQTKMVRVRWTNYPANPKGAIIWQGPKPKVNGSRRIFMSPLSINGDGALKVWCRNLLRLRGCVYWVISETVRRRWWDLRIFFLGCLFDRPIRGKIKNLKTSHTLLVTTRIGLMVKWDWDLALSVRWAAIHIPLPMVHRQQVDLVGARRAWFPWRCNHTKRAVRRAQFVRWCLAGYSAILFFR